MEFNKASQAFIVHPLPTKASTYQNHRSPTSIRRHVITTNMVAPRRTRVTSTPQNVQTAGRVLLEEGTLPTSQVQVDIEAPSRNKRIIRASNLINAPLPIVWNLLSDYEHLADNIPNLVMSELRPHPRKDGIRVEQCGAQNILGFQFRASLVMDMKEENSTSLQRRAIYFDLVKSRDFNEFEGSWEMINVGNNKTALYYTVAIVPRGLVPVKAIEWRISEDVPGNMNAVRSECERRRRSQVLASRRQISQS